MSVKVAVRVRPFNQRELEMKSQLCVDMKGNQTILIDTDDNGNTRDFAFDYSFWSHDEFENNEEGLSVPLSDKYADQKKVYEAVGCEILDNAWQGYHCCLFAYGQTGAGKSYSMIGYGKNKGIVPMACEEIFQRIRASETATKSYEVMFSMLEIYNEKVQDLLIPTNQRPAGGLKIREHKSMGVFVEGLSKHPVDSYEAIEEKTDEGNTNRTIGATQMNATSSRAHTIITIEFRQKEVVDAKRTQEKLSVINLVDLAGSEKLSKTGATGDRMKEGASINKSLTVLGIVISNLALASEGKKKVVVPYRDSALTRILQNALGGNSKTLMICAISPAQNNYDETLSTLRYADQAKKIKNCAIVNESEQDKMIRELKEENDKLKNLLAGLGSGSSPQQLMEVLEQLQANVALMKEHEKSYDQRLEEAKHTREKGNAADKSLPHIFNLNEDPLLTGKVTYILSAASTTVGKRNADGAPDIVLGSIGIRPQHAVFANRDGQVFLSPCVKEAAEYVSVNGEHVHEERRLRHLDRIVFGTNAVFLFKNPGHEDEAEGVAEAAIDWEFAQKELTSQEEEKLDKEKAEEIDSKLKEMEEQLRREKAEKEKAMLAQKEEFERRIKELETRVQGDEHARKETENEGEALLRERERFEADYASKERDMKKRRASILDEGVSGGGKEKERLYLEHKLAKYLPKITEVNLIAKELKRDVTLCIKLSYEGADLLSWENKGGKPMKIQVQVHNREEGQVYLWSLDKFTNRYYIIKEVVERYFEEDALPTLSKDEDPFWDPPETHVLCQGFLKMMSLPYLLDNPIDILLVGDSGAVGHLSVDLIPTDESGEVNICETTDITLEDPNELLGKRLDFVVVVKEARFQENFFLETFVEYAIVNQDGRLEKFRTGVVSGLVQNPKYKHRKHHIFSCLTETQIHYLINHNLCFNVCGHQLPRRASKILDPRDLQRMQEESKRNETQSKAVQNLVQSVGAIHQQGQAPAFVPQPQPQQPVHYQNPNPPYQQQQPHQQQQKEKDCAIF